MRVYVDGELEPVFREDDPQVGDLVRLRHSTFDPHTFVIHESGDVAFVLAKDERGFRCLTKMGVVSFDDGTDIL